MKYYSLAFLSLCAVIAHAQETSEILDSLKYDTKTSTYKSEKPLYRDLTDNPDARANAEYYQHARPGTLTIHDGMGPSGGGGNDFDLDLKYRANGSPSALTTKSVAYDNETAAFTRLMKYNFSSDGKVESLSMTVKKFSKIGGISINQDLCKKKFKDLLGHCLNQVNSARTSLGQAAWTIENFLGISEGYFNQLCSVLKNAKISQNKNGKLVTNLKEIEELLAAFELPNSVYRPQSVIYTEHGE